MKKHIGNIDLDTIFYNIGNQLENIPGYVAHSDEGDFIQFGVENDTVPKSITLTIDLDIYECSDQEMDDFKDALDLL